jgi:hypothetical protein
MLLGRASRVFIVRLRHCAIAVRAREGPLTDPRTDTQRDRLALGKAVRRIYRGRGRDAPLKEGALHKDTRRKKQRRRQSRCFAQRSGRQRCTPSPAAQPGHGAQRQDDPINIQYTARAKAIRMRIWPGFHPRSDNVMMMSVGQTLSRRIVKSRGPGHSTARPAIPGTCRLNRGLRVETRPSKLIRGGSLSL